MKIKELFFGILMIGILFSAGSGSGGSAGASISQPCTADTWTCAEFSKCDASGFQSRTCTKTFDCGNAETKKPEDVLSCKYVSELVNSLKCQNKPDMKERIKCRLDLTPEDQLKEIEISYLPEECRAMDTEGKKEVCVKNYASIQKCWEKEDNVRSCLRDVTKLPLDLEKEIKTCKSLGQPARSLCTSSIKDSAYSYIKFNMYYLEKEAEDWMAKGKISKEEVVKFIQDIELQKQDFNSANTYTGKENVLLNTDNLWKEFVKKVKK